MAHFQVIFEGTDHNIAINHFDEFGEAMEHWQEYADFCEAGEMLDLDNGEIIWEFGEEF